MIKALRRPCVERSMAALALCLSRASELAAVGIRVAGRTFGRCSPILQNIFLAPGAGMTLDTGGLCMTLAPEECAHVLMLIFADSEVGKVRCVAGGAIVLRYHSIKLGTVRIGVTVPAGGNGSLEFPDFGIGVDPMALDAGNCLMSIKQRIGFRMIRRTDGGRIKAVHGMACSTGCIVRLELTGVRVLVAGGALIRTAVVIRGGRIRKSRGVGFQPGIMALGALNPHMRSLQHESKVVVIGNIDTTRSHSPC